MRITRLLYGLYVMITALLFSLALWRGKLKTKNKQMTAPATRQRTTMRGKRCDLHGKHPDAKPRSNKSKASR